MKRTLAADVSIVANLDDKGQTTFSRLASKGALVARPTPSALYLVGASASPIGGDNLNVEITLGKGADLVVRSSGATLARHGPPGAMSHSTTTAILDEHASLAWLVEPGIAATGAVHESHTKVTMALSASLIWREDVVLGRQGELIPGSWRSTLDIRTGNLATGTLTPVLVADMWLGTVSNLALASIVIGNARALSTVVVVDQKISEQSIESIVEPSPEVRGALFPLRASAVEIVAWGDDLLSCQQHVNDLARHAGITIDRDNAS